MDGARIILKSHYVNARKNSRGDSGRYAQYIGTREGAVMIEKSERDKPVTNSQMQFIDDITKEVPEIKKSASYYDYKSNQTLGTASDFISSAIDEYGYQIEGIDGYAKYMATRPGVTKVEKTGLFSDFGKDVDLEDVMDKLKNYKGNVYMPIISLRPEDSLGLGYDNPQAWQKLICNHRSEIAKQYKIPPEHFKWVGAYHNAVNAEGFEHNHIHMIIWSTNPNDGWQSVETGNNIREILAKDIFKDELKNTYELGTSTRNEIRKVAYDKVQSILNNTATFENSDLVKKEIAVLAESLKAIKGRKYYAYLPKEEKQMVDNILQDLVDGDPKLKELLNLWADTKERQIKIYSTGSYKMPPISELKEFNPIKNKIINAAIAYNKSVSKLAKVEKEIKKLKEHEERELSYEAEKLTTSILRTLARNLEEPNEGRIPKRVHVKEAEDIDAQVRRSQGMH